MKRDIIWVFPVFIKKYPALRRVELSAMLANTMADAIKPSQVAGYYRDNRLDFVVGLAIVEI